MPSYDYRCNQCGRPFALFFKSIKDYDPAAEHTCPHCQSSDVVRRIRRVAIQKPGRDLSSLNSNEMLNVFNSGNPREVGKMFEQVAATTGEDLGGDFNEATERLLKGESMDSVEQDLSSRSGNAAGDDD
ncbi:MAG: zinc ribbon domain-containing protein [Anaerolineae bacterium]